MFRFVVAPLIDRWQTRSRRHWLLWQLQAAFAGCFLLLAVVPPEAGMAAIIAVLAALNVLAAVLNAALEGFAVRTVPAEWRTRASAIRLISYYAGSIAASAGLISGALLLGWRTAVITLAAVPVAAALAAFRWRGIGGMISASPAWRDFRLERSFMLLMPVAFLLDLPQNIGIALLGPILTLRGYGLEAAALLTGGAGLAAAAAGALLAGFRRTSPSGRSGQMVLVAAIQGLALVPLAAVISLGDLPRAAVVTAICAATASAGAFNTVFAAWFMDRVQPATAATQMAILSSLHSASAVIAGPIAGYAVGEAGVSGFLVAAALASIAMIPLLLAAPAPRGTGS